MGTNLLLKIYVLFSWISTVCIDANNKFYINISYILIFGNIDGMTRWVLLLWTREDNFKQGLHVFGEAIEDNYHFYKNVQHSNPYHTCSSSIRDYNLNIVMLFILKISPVSTTTLRIWMLANTPTHHLWAILKNVTTRISQLVQHGGGYI